MHYRMVRAGSGRPTALICLLRAVNPEGPKTWTTEKSLAANPNLFRSAFALCPQTVTTRHTMGEAASVLESRLKSQDGPGTLIRLQCLCQRATWMRRVDCPTKCRSRSPNTPQNSRKVAKERSTASADAEKQRREKWPVPEPRDGQRARGRRGTRDAGGRTVRERSR